ncbi:hypothetical protein KBZ08_16120 [Cyanobium sp. Candia 9D4]|uniref:hypothetical protein n=1 Tax=Cyanobium sp. Candia 9D4 TaxID=2823707 RepID=UPI0020CE7996|nr:hypothetical protein [Cyanobium sp. Candia 9D4]MCP9935438.1 hypothetical protein [Cyanobium sp. Candia 9D4]
MACHTWLVAGLITLPGALAQASPGPPPPPPPVSPARSGAEILGRPGIRTRYGDPGGPSPAVGGQGLPSVGPPERPLTVPVNERVDFTPTMEEGPFQQPTLRGLFRWDLQQPASR